MTTEKVLRSIDVLMALIGLFFSLPLMMVVALVGFFDTGAPIFRQQRVGRYQKPFVLYKFRSMRLDTPSVATHLARKTAITPFGRFLRRTKVDELPQLWNVLKGDMSLVGPRPCLLDQSELITERAARGVFKVRPGITGLAQTQGIDMSDPRKLAEVDAAMLGELDLRRYLRYLFLTMVGRGQGDRVRENRAD